MYVIRFLSGKIALIGLLLLWPVLLIVAIMVKVKMPGGPAFFCGEARGQRREVVLLLQVPQYDSEP